MKKINPNGSKTLYVSGIYEVEKASGGSVTRTVTYYPVAGAMRIDSTLYYVLKDHLGSASVITNASGIEVGAQRYYPFGETRLTTGTIYTDKLFTGQREMAGLGIYHYQARFYSPKLGRFLSADTIVPSYSNPQALNRYSYVYNAPLNYIDPSGHDADYFCSGSNDYSSSCTGYVQAQATLGSNMGGGGGGGGDDDDEPDPSNDEPGGTPPAPSSGGVACGQAGYYSAHCAGWHFYRIRNIVCPAYFNCTAEQMQDYLKRFAFPGQDPNSPVSNNAENFVWVNGIIPLGQIQTEVDGLATTNITRPLHAMYDGQVERRAIQNSDGSWSVVTTGMGNNRQMPGPVFGSSLDFASINQALGPGAFNDLDQAMLNYIVENQ